MQFQSVSVRDLSAAFVLAEVRPIVKTVVRKLVRDRSKRPDAEQECNIKILRALPRYDPAKSRLTTFAHICSRSATLDFLRREARVANVLIVDPVHFDERPAAAPDVDENRVRQELRNLSPLQRRVVQYLVAHPRSTKPDVCRAARCDRNIVRRCRKWLGERGFTFPTPSEIGHARSSTKHRSATRTIEPLTTPLAA